MAIAIDFRNDYFLIRKNELIALNINIKEAIPIDKIPYIYFNFRKRIVFQKPRRILKANDFTCPADLLDGLNNLEKKIIDGDDLRPHLSTRVSMKYEGVDYLLNDWGIHHLHLGIEIEKDYVNRTDLVLFCKVTDDIIYFITIMQHEKWAEQSLLMTIYKNWPDLIKPFIMSGINMVDNKYSNQDIMELRDGNLMYLVELEAGVVISPPGGGYATDGTSREVVTKVHNELRILTDFEEKIKANESNLRRRIVAENITPARTLKFKLKITENGLIAYEVYSKMMFSVI